MEKYNKLKIVGKGIIIPSNICYLGSFGYALLVESKE